jgi:uncharacterized protein
MPDDRKSGAARYKLKPRETVSMKTRDGVRLEADIYRPDAVGPFPVLLMRQPYGRSIASTVVYAHPSWYAQHGYIVVIQDVRGRGTSEGEFRIFESEIADGADTLDWAAKLPGSSGVIGMYGFSYQGMTQLFAAATKHPALKALCPAMSAWDVYSDIAFEGDAFRLYAGLGWGAQLSAEAARRAGNVDAHRALVSAARAMPLNDAIPAMPDVMQRYGQFGHYPAWISHPEPGPFWEKISPRSHADKIDVPMLHVGGWYDGMLSGTLGCYHDMVRRKVANQKLVVGPWVHIPWATKVGEVEFGEGAINMIDHLQIQWFDHWLKGIDTGVMKQKPVRLFEMGGSWSEFDSWPAAAKDMHLRSCGRAGLDPRDGVLTESGGPSGEDVLVFDPWRPTPTVGGHKAYPLGPANRASADMRPDVATFTMPVQKTDLHLAGNVAATLFVEADQPSLDVCAILSEVKPDGRVINLTEGYARLDKPTSPVTIAMRATCACIKAGSALRLSVSPGSFPAHPVNTGDGSPPATARLIDQRIITLTLRHGGTTPSRVMLPVVAGP